MKFKVKNFQSLKELELEVEKGDFVVINGASSTGKSAFRRAVGALFYNDWDKSFIKNGEKETEVSFTDGGLYLSILKPENTYLLDGIEYKKIGADLPEVLKDRLRERGVHKFGVGDEEYDILIEGQLGRMFFVEGSQAENSKILSRVFDVDRYAAALAILQKDIYNQKVEIGKEEKELSELEEELKRKEKDVLVLERLVKREERLELVRDFEIVRVRKGKVKEKELLSFYEGFKVIEEGERFLKRERKRALLSLLGLCYGVEELRLVLEEKRKVSLKERKVLESLKRVMLIEKYEKVLRERIEDRELILKLKGRFLRICAFLFLLKRLEVLGKKGKWVLIGSCELARTAEEDCRAKKGLLMKEIGRLKGELPELCPVCGKPLE